MARPDGSKYTNRTRRWAWAAMTFMVITAFCLLATIWLDLRWLPTGILTGLIATVIGKRVIELGKDEDRVYYKDHPEARED